MSQKDIAVIGMSGRFPDADNLLQFSQNLNAGRDSVREISQKRMRNTTIPPTEDYRIGGYIEGIDLFDPLFFNISPAEAEYMDPTQRLLLEVVYETIENAGYNIDDFRGSRTGVYVGDTNLAYYLHFNKNHPTSLTGNLTGVTAGRISRFFDLHGVSTMVDTTCSSSLVAINLALQGLFLEDIDQALICGARLMLFPDTQTSELAPGVASIKGKTKAFDSGADGTGSGESICCILLKPLDKALLDNDIIHAVIKGAAVNQDALRSATLTAPSSKAQAEVLVNAWKNGGINPETITYIEAHGTGTKLGDPIEIDGINQAFRTFTNKIHFCAVASLKTNIGHTDTAAGISSFIKAVLSLKQRRLFPSLNFDEPNPFIDFDASPVYINATSKPWDLPEGVDKRRAGVSSFGLSGTNCHIVIEEAPQGSPPEVPQIGKSYLIAISAKEKVSLEKNTAALMAHLASAGNECSLANISYTLLKGRKHYAHRAAIVVDSLFSIPSAILETNDPPARLEAQKFIVTFSDHADISATLIADFVNQYPSFRSLYTTCIQCLPLGQGLSSKTRVFIFQYCFFNLLDSKGLGIEILIGDGIGELVVDVITGSRTLQEGIEATRKADTKSKGDLKDRCQKFLEECNGKFLLVAEMGPPGSLSATLQTPIREFSKVVALNSLLGSNCFLDYVKSLYLENADIDWNKFFKGEAGRRIELPTYQFNRKRCWVKEPTETRVEDGIYELKWYPSVDASTPSEILSITPLVVFMDKEGLGDEFISKLSGEIITVSYSQEYRRLSSYSYQINPLSESDYMHLSDDLDQDWPNINGIVDLKDYGNHTSLPSEAFSMDQIYSRLYLFKTFHSKFLRMNIRIAIVTCNAFRVINSDEVPDPATSLTLTFARAMAVEFPKITVVGIDMSYRGKAHCAEAAGQIIQELQRSRSDSIVSYRADIRYLQNVAAIESPKAEDTLDGFAPGSVYLITGGARGIGYALAESLVERVSGCKLIIIGRSELPDKALWNSMDPSFSEEVSEKITLLQKLESKGAEVFYYSADVGIKDEIQRAFVSIKKKFRKIDGVIHSAGVPAALLPIKKKTVNDFNITFSPKINGTILLDEATRAFNPRFFIMSSSLNAVLPAKHGVDYAIANAFQNNYAAYQRQQGRNFISINWPGWSETGMKFRYLKGKKEALTDINKKYLKDITTEEGIKVFYHALAIAKSNLFIAPGGYDPSDFYDKTITQNNEELPNEIAKIKTYDNCSVESELMHLWKTTLRVDSVDSETDFFDLGGNSLVANQLINHVKKEFNVELTFEDILDNATIRSLTVLIQTLRKKDAVLFSPIAPIEEQEYYCVSHSQKRLWIINEVEDDITAYHIPAAYELEGINCGLFERALYEVVNRHESLRTTFISVAGEPKQKVNKPESLDFKIQYTDVRNFGGEDKIIDLIHADIKSRFDLQSGPLIRARLMQKDASRFVFAHTMHHIISDEWSGKIFVSEVLYLYQSYSRGNNPRLNRLDIHYKDFTAWQNDQISKKSSEFRSYWRETLKGSLPQLNFPSDHPRPNFKTYDGSRLMFSIGEERSMNLRNVAKANNATLFTILLSCVKTLLYHYTRLEDIIVGSPVAGREHVDLENQIGFYVNTVALRTQLKGDYQFVKLLERVKEVVLGAHKHQLYPFDMVVGDLKLKGDSSRSPLFDIMITFQGLDKNENARSLEQEMEIGAKAYVTNLDVSKFDMTLYFVEFHDEIGCSIQYNTNLFSTARINVLKEHLIEIIDQAYIDPNLSLDELKDKVDSKLRRQDSALNVSFNFG